MMKAEDTIAIYNLMGRYGHIMDETAMAGGAWGVLDEIFTQDAVFDLTAMGGPKLEGFDAIRQAWDQGVHPFGHHVTNLVVTPVDADTALCDSKLIVILADGRANTGHYRDQVVRTNQGWKIIHRSTFVRRHDLAAPVPVFAEAL